MKRFLAAIALASLSWPAFAQAPLSPGQGGTGTGSVSNAAITAAGGTTARTLAARAADVFNAQDYGTCTWGTAGGNDAGPCINAAIAAAAAAGGGEVDVPAGAFNVATALTQTTSGVHVVGAGVGIPRDSVSPSIYLAATRLIWTGASGVPMFSVAGGGTSTLYSVDVKGIVFDCNNLASICAQFTNVTYSTLILGASEPQSVGILFTTAGAGGSDGPGNQENDMWLYSRSTSGTYSPTGIMFDQGAGSSWNTSYNRIHLASAWYAQGDGIVFGSSDNNVIYDIKAYANPGNATGRGVVFANAAYKSPNGLTVNGTAYDSMVVHTGAAVTITGFQAGSTVTAGGGNAGSAAATTTSLTTNGATAIGTLVLNFGATTGVANGEVVNCGGSNSGVQPNSSVSSTSGTTVTLNNPTYGVASGTTCTFSYGFVTNAAAGTYTITAASASTFNITAPPGGHSQSGVAYSGGVVAFIDMVIPMTGTPVAGDTFTVVAPAPANNITVNGVDKANAVNQPLFEIGANGWYTTTRNPIPQTVGGTGNIIIGLAQVSNGGLTIGGSVSGASGIFATTIGGIAAIASGIGATAAGHNTLSNGSYSFAFGEGTTATGLATSATGEGTTASGSYSRTGGNGAADRSRFATDCWSSGNVAAQGDAQVCTQTPHGTGSTATAFRLTADGNAAGSANCINIPNNSAYLVTIDITAFDHTTVSKNAVWPTWTGLMTRGASAATTAVAMNTTPTPLTNGTLTGQAIAVTADTTNGCLNVTYTPPTLNVDLWHVVAHVETVEVQ
jgi:hypothetical protein